MLLSGIIGAVLGGLVTSLMHFWKFHRDELTSRIDDLCRAVTEAARLGADYWSEAFGENEDTRRRVAEALILGQQALIDGLYADLRVYLGRGAAEIDGLLAYFEQCLSGGEFSVGGREADFGRTAGVPQAGSDLIVGIRRIHRTTMPMHRLARAAAENRSRELDMPQGWPNSRTGC